MAIRLPMSEKEIVEARQAWIPDSIIGKMARGFELSEKEKEVVRDMGKVYVLGHTKERGQIRIKPQLRDLPGNNRSKIKVVYEDNLKESRKLSEFDKETEEEINTLLGYVDEGLLSRDTIQQQLDEIYLRVGEKAPNIRDLVEPNFFDMHPHDLMMYEPKDRADRIGLREGLINYKKILDKRIKISDEYDAEQYSKVRDKVESRIFKFE